MEHFSRPNHANSWPVRFDMEPGNSGWHKEACQETTKDGKQGAKLKLKLGNFYESSGDFRKERELKDVNKNLGHKNGLLIFLELVEALKGSLVYNLTDPLESHDLSKENTRLLWITSFKNGKG